jgi:hypothetical protein
MHFRVSIASNCRVLTRYMNVSNAQGHEEARNLYLFIYCVLSIL